MPVPNTMADLFTLAGSNSPAGTEVIGNSLDNYIRAQAAILRSTNALSSATIAAASTTDIASSDAEYVQVTGTATITSLGTGFNGCRRQVRFTSTPTLSHSASIVLPGAANITVAAGEVMTFRCTGSGQWTMVGRARTDVVGALGYAPVNKAGDQMTGNLEIAKDLGNLSMISVGGVKGYRFNANISDALDGGFRIQNFNGSWNTALTVNGTSGITVTGSVNAGNDITIQKDLPQYNLYPPSGSGSANQWNIRANISDSVNGGVQVRNGAVTRLNIASDGTCTALNFVATSDRRLKDQITDRKARHGLADKLRLVDFVWRDGGKKDQGLIAQEVREVAPEYVVEDGGLLAVDKMGLLLECVMDLAARLRELEK